MAVPVRAMECIEQVVVSGGIDWPRFEMQRLVLATRLGGTRPRKVAEVPHSPGDGRTLEPTTAPCKTPDAREDAGCVSRALAPVWPWFGSSN